MRWWWCVLAMELALGSWWVARRASLPLPPVVDASITDASSAADLAEWLERCRGDSVDAWTHAGEALQSCGFFPEAEVCLGRAAQLAPKDPEAAYRWGLVLIRVARYEQAREQFKLAARLRHPRSDACWYFIGRCWLRDEHPDEARDAFLRARTLPAARYELARLALRRGAVDEAVTLLDELERQDPGSIDVGVLLARADGYRGVDQDDPEAVEQADLAKHRLESPFLDEAFRFHDVRSHIGIVPRQDEAQRLVTDGRLDDAAAVLRRLLDERFSSAIAIHLADVLHSAQRDDEAVEVLQEAVRRAGPSPDRLIHLADILDGLGRTDEALAARNRAVAMRSGPAVVDAHLALAELHERRGDKELSARHLALARLGEGQQACWQGDWKTAAEQLDQAVAIDPQLAEAWYYLGEARRHSRRPETAVEAYERCVELRPEHGGALTRLGR